MRNSFQFWGGRLSDVENVKESSLTWFHSPVHSVNIRCMVNEADIALHYKLMKLIEKRPEISQRELAAELGLSLGKVNYCLKAFIARGLVKVSNFRRSDNKRAYAYLLTPQGIEEKARVTVRFFRRVETEYETLKQEMENLGGTDKK